MADIIQAAHTFFYISCMPSFFYTLNTPLSRDNAAAGAAAAAAAATVLMSDVTAAIAMTAGGDTAAATALMSDSTDVTAAAIAVTAGGDTAAAATGSVSAAAGDRRQTQTITSAIGPITVPPVAGLEKTQQPRDNSHYQPAVGPNHSNAGNKPVVGCHKALMIIMAILGIMCRIILFLTMGSNTKP